MDIAKPFTFAQKDVEPAPCGEQMVGDAWTLTGEDCREDAGCRVWFDCTSYHLERDAADLTEDDQALYRDARFKLAFGKGGDDRHEIIGF